MACDGEWLVVVGRYLLLLVVIGCCWLLLVVAGRCWLLLVALPFRLVAGGLESFGKAVHVENAQRRRFLRLCAEPRGPRFSSGLIGSRECME